MEEETRVVDLTSHPTQGGAKKNEKFKAPLREGWGVKS
jgi:hypothetical protein